MLSEVIPEQEEPQTPGNDSNDGKTPD